MSESMSDEMALVYPTSVPMHSGWASHQCTCKDRGPAFDPAVANPIFGFTVGFVKGSARVSTLMAVLALCFEDRVDIKTDQASKQAWACR